MLFRSARSNTLPIKAVALMAEFDQSYGKSRPSFSERRGAAGRGAFAFSAGAVNLFGLAVRARLRDGVRCNAEGIVAEKGSCSSCPSACKIAA